MTGMHSNTDTFKLTVCLVLALLFRFAAAEAQVASPASADVFAQVREGMSSNEVKALLGAPIYERKREGATYSFAWVYCCIPHGAHQTEPNRHPHFWIEFSKDEETV